MAGKYKTYLNYRYASDKEARAVVHLFARKQTGGGLWLGTGAAFMAFVASQTGTKTTASGTTKTTVTPLGYGLILGLFGGVGVGKLTRYSNEKLYKVLSAYDQGNGLPEGLMGQLKPKDYQ